MVDHDDNGLCYAYDDRLLEVRFQEETKTEKVLFLIHIHPSNENQVKDVCFN